MPYGVHESDAYVVYGKDKKKSKTLKCRIGMATQIRQKVTKPVMHQVYQCTVHAYITTEAHDYHILHTQDTKTFPKCYVGRNGKQKQQCRHTNQILAHTFSHGTLDSVVS